MADMNRSDRCGWSSPALARDEAFGECRSTRATESLPVELDSGCARKINAKLCLDLLAHRLVCPTAEEDLAERRCGAA
jgi:hypothetical protein